MMPTRILTTLLLAVLLSSCDGNTGLNVEDPDIFVVQAYLYAGEPLRDVTVTRVLPLDADTSDVAPPISDAAVRVLRGADRYELVPTPGAPGNYYYPGDDLVIRPGDLFRLEVSVDGHLATSETVVPTAPRGLALSTDSVQVPEGPGTGGPGPGGPGPGFGGLAAGVTLHWINTASQLHYPVVDNVEADPVPFTTNERFRRFAPRFIGQPTAADSTMVGVLSLTHYGRHRVRLYHVNDEYANLFRGLSQDSRDLNEPPSNVKGALGVFSAFTADSAFFRVH